MSTQELVQKVKEAGQSIIDNAKSIVGDYKYQTEICIYVTLAADDAFPEIRAEQAFIPEKYMDRRCLAKVGLEE